MRRLITLAVVALIASASVSLAGKSLVRVYFDDLEHRKTVIVQFEDVASWGGKRYFGDVELVQWIERHQPSIVISGHVHQSPFITDGSWFDRIGATWAFNAGLQPGRPPTYMVLDIDEGTVFWLAAGHEQYIDLNAPLRRPAARIANPPPWLTSLDRIAGPIPAKPASAAG